MIDPLTITLPPPGAANPARPLAIAGDAPDRFAITLATVAPPITLPGLPIDRQDAAAPGNDLPEADAIDATFDEILTDLFPVVAPEPVPAPVAVPIVAPVIAPVGVPAATPVEVAAPTPSPAARRVATTALTPVAPEAAPLPVVAPASPPRAAAAPFRPLEAEATTATVPTQAATPIAPTLLTEPSAAAVGSPVAAPSADTNIQDTVPAQVPGIATTPRAATPTTAARQTEAPPPIAAPVAMPQSVAVETPAVARGRAATRTALAVPAGFVPPGLAKPASPEPPRATPGVEMPAAPSPAEPALAGPAGQVFARQLAQQPAVVTDEPLPLPIEGTAIAEVTGEPQLTAATPARAPAAIASPELPPIDTGRAAWLEGMIDRIETLRDEPGGRALRIRLSPDALGEIELTFDEGAGRDVGVRIHAENPAARTMLAEAAPRLAELAEARGIRLAPQGDVGATAGSSGSGGNSPGSSASGGQSTLAQSGTGQQSAQQDGGHSRRSAASATPSPDPRRDARADRMTDDDRIA